MFLTLNHQKLEIYTISKLFVVECYKLTNQLPAEERYGIISQIRRAALSVHLNISEGASRKSEAERKRYYEVSRGSVIEIDGALDLASDLGSLKKIDTAKLGEVMVTCFKILTGLIKANSKN
ncbi:MAG: four helix bundle protein [Bacteroidota bacterium]